MLRELERSVPGGGGCGPFQPIRSNEVTLRRGAFKGASVDPLEPRSPEVNPAALAVRPVRPYCFRW